MDTIGSVDYERQPHVRQTPPTVALSDRDSDHGGRDDSDDDGHHGNNVQDPGAAPVRRVASLQHTLNVTV